MEEYMRMVDSDIMPISLDSYYGSAGMSGHEIWGIVALIIAIVGAGLIYFLFVKAKNEPKNKYLKWLKDFLSFKTMWVESLLKMIYYGATIFYVLYSFALIQFGFWTFFQSFVVAPVVLRLGYEVAMMFVGIWRNTTDLAKKK